MYKLPFHLKLKQIVSGSFFSPIHEQSIPIPYIPICKVLKPLILNNKVCISRDFFFFFFFGGGGRRFSPKYFTSLIFEIPTHSFHQMIYKDISIVSYYGME